MMLYLLAPQNNSIELNCFNVVPRAGHLKLKLAQPDPWDMKFEVDLFYQLRCGPLLLIINPEYNQGA